MTAARIINSRNLVVASETLPAQFRPSNQLRMVRAQATNPSLHASTNFRPGLAEYRDGNGCGDLGLGWSLARAANRSFLRQGFLVAPEWASEDDRSTGTRRVATSDATPVNYTPPMVMSAPSAAPAPVSGLAALPDQLTSALGGLGEIAVAPLGLACLAVAAFYILAKNKARA